MKIVVTATTLVSLFLIIGLLGINNNNNSNNIDDVFAQLDSASTNAQTDPVADIASNKTEDALSTYTKKDSNMAIGNAWFKKLDTNLENTTSTYVVTFEPGARNHWHSYPGQQIL